MELHFLHPTHHHSHGEKTLDIYRVYLHLNIDRRCFLLNQCHLSRQQKDMKYVVVVVVVAAVAVLAVVVVVAAGCCWLLRFFCCLLFVGCYCCPF